MKKFLSARVPSINEIVLVFAFTAFLVYGRALYVFIWKLPSWLKLLTTGEILIVLSYSLVLSLAETAAIALALLMISFILPANWFRNSFAVRGVWIAFVCLVSLIALFGFFDILFPHIVKILWRWSAVTIGMAFLAAFIAPRVHFMRVASLWFADRTIIFLYLLIPASVIGLIVTAIRLIMVY